MRYSYNSVVLRKTVYYECILCKKKRSKTFCDYQSLNPFNKRIDGSQKTRSDIHRELSVTLKDKVESFSRICSKCETQGGAE